MGDERETILINRQTPLFRSSSHAYDELRSFRSWLLWLCVDQSKPWTTCLSWFVFILFAIVVPCLSHFYLDCSDCDHKYNRPFDKVVQLSLSSLATLSFVSLSRFVRRYGLRRFLFFDKLCNESETVRNGYTRQLDRSLELLFIFVLPCFAAECAYKIWWYSSGFTRIPFLVNSVVSDTVSCFFELCSWLYRTVVFFLVCVLFHLICQLQILRLQDFAQVFKANSDVESVLREHLRVRRHLRIISHRYRVFILWALIIITASQFTSLLMITRTSSNADINIFKAGELALCSVSVLAGLLILLRSATRITHKAQAVTCLAAKWHACATIESFDSADADSPTSRMPSHMPSRMPSHVPSRMPSHMPSRMPSSVPSRQNSWTDEFSDGDDVEDEEDELDNTELIPAYAFSTISFQKRQALVTYFENNRAGITVYGFMLDRTSLHTIFGIELSLVLWLLGKTIGIS